MSPNMRNPTHSRLYDQSFYRTYRDGSLRSARVVVPKIMKMIAPASVIDVGCGVGTWLKAFSEQGVARIRAFPRNASFRTT